MEDGSLMVELASGSTLKPDFSNYNFSSAKKVGKIVKDVTKNLLMKKDQIGESNAPVEIAEIRGKQHVIGSTYGVPKLDVNENIKDRQSTEDLSMVERLKGANAAPHLASKTLSSGA